MFEPQPTGETVPLPPVPPLPQEHQPQPPARYPFRLLRNERVIATFPITHRKRLMGEIASYLFVTDSRIIYAADCDTWFSHSSEVQEHRLDKIEGLETRRRRGMSALGIAIAIGVVLHIGALFSFSGSVTSMIVGASQLTYGAVDLGTVLPVTAFFGTLILISALAGVAVVLSLLRPTAYLGVFGVGNTVAFAESRDWVTIVVTTILFLILGPLALIFWMAARGLGLFQASDAFLYADAKNIDAIAYQAGAVILDAQARGTLAGS